MHFNNSTSNESNWAEEEEAAGQRLMCMVFIKAGAKRCKERKDGGKEGEKMHQKSLFAHIQHG